MLRHLPATALLLAVALAGCNDQNRQALTELDPTPDGFVYRAYADVAYDDEAQRMRWLDEQLAMNGMCPKGYEIESRDRILVREGLIGDISRIIYVGRCLD